MNIPDHIINNIIMFNRPSYCYMKELRRVSGSHYYLNRRSFKKLYRSIVLNGIKNFGVPMREDNNYRDRPFVLELVFNSIKCNYGYFYRNRFTLNDIKTKKINKPLKVILRLDKVFY